MEMKSPSAIPENKATGRFGHPDQASNWDTTFGEVRLLTEEHSGGV